MYSSSIKISDNIDFGKVVIYGDKKYNILLRSITNGKVVFRAFDGEIGAILRNGINHRYTKIHLGIDDDSIGVPSTMYLDFNVDQCTLIKPLESEFSFGINSFLKRFKNNIYIGGEMEYGISQDIDFSATKNLPLNNSEYTIDMSVSENMVVLRKLSEVDDYYLSEIDEQSLSTLDYITID